MPHWEKRTKGWTVNRWKKNRTFHSLPLQKMEDFVPFLSSRGVVFSSPVPVEWLEFKKRCIPAPLSNEKRAPGWLDFIGDEILPSFVGMIITHYKDSF